MQLNLFNKLELCRLHPSHRHTMRIISTMLLLLAFGQLVAWQLPDSKKFLVISGFLPLHTLLETIAIMIAMLVFAIGWNSHSRNLSGSIVLLACVFFTVGWLDFSHTLSYKGMPDFVTPSDPEKGLIFWLSARLIASLSLLAVAIMPWRPFASAMTRYLLMATGVILILLVNWLVLFHQESIPHTFIPGKGLTPLKINLEYLFIALNLLTALLFWRRMRRPQSFNAALLFGAVCTMAMSEFFFTLYTTTTDIYNVLGHLYKVAAYLMIYRAIVVEGIEIPYRKLKEARQDLSLAVQASNTGLWDWTVGSEDAYYSPMWKAQLGYQSDELPNKFSTWESLLHPEDREQAVRLVQDFIASSAQGYKNEFRMRHRDGSYRWILARAESQYDAKGNLVRLIGSHIDITEQKRTEEELRIAATAFESHEGMLITDADCVILRVNHAFVENTGYTTEEVVGQKPNIFKSGRHSTDFYREMWASVIHSGFWEGEIWGRRKDGDIFPKWLNITAVKGADGNVTHYVGSFIDISERKAAEEKIQHLAFYDSLTNLPNRRLLLDRLSHALAASSRSGQLGALLLLDLDNFKTINDTLGHDIGDLLLQQVAQRLTTCVREGDTVARLGGDEFVIILEGLSEKNTEAAAQAEFIAEKILSTLNQPYKLSRYKHHSTPSIGITLFGDQAESVDGLIKQADIAMYQAKNGGRNALRFFDPLMQDAINIRVDMERELRKAIDENQFQLHYQIQVDSSGHALGAEALIRWEHPERGIIYPFHFIPMAEETGLILTIGQWVLNAACAQLKQWRQNEVTRDLILAINVSAKQFRQTDFVAQVFATVQRHGVDPTRLKLELTESMLVDNIKDIITSMTALKAFGIKFSLDDFGTGYSSLQYIKMLPLDQIKIDQSFVRDIASDSSDKAIILTIITMARNLGLNVIAEGVETEDQKQFLLDNDCNHYQGYLFSKPVPIEQFEALLAIALAH